MSSYYINLKHKETGEIHRIFAIDDYFGWHHYGYELPNNTVVTEEYLDILYEKEHEET